MNLAKSMDRPVVLFDLDGSLLPMEQKDFERAYFHTLCQSFPEVPPKKLCAAVWAGVSAMVRNDGRQTNREVFANVFTRESGMDYYINEPLFLEYYRTSFQSCRDVCLITEQSRMLVELLRKKGRTVAVATNPIFPKIATYSRLRWLGLDPLSFPLVTTFEDCHYGKPNPKYYQEVLEHLNVRPNDCLMVGNDVEEDGCARELGLEVFLLTEHLINYKNLSIDSFPQGTLSDFLSWAESLPTAGRYVSCGA